MRRSSCFFGVSGLGLLLVIACQDSPGPKSSPAGDAGADAGACIVGDESCTCYPNSTCNGSLRCTSSICVAATDTRGEAGAAGQETATDAGAPTDLPSGGTSAGGTSAGGMSAGGASAVGGTAAGGESSAGAAGSSGKPGIDPRVLVIDAFTDCNADIDPIDGRVGSWTPLPATKEFKVGTAPKPSWLNQTCGVWVTGPCADCGEMGLSVSLSPQTYDLSRFSGLRVSYESESTIMLRIQAKNNGSHSFATTAAIPPGGPQSVATVLFDKFSPAPNFEGIDKADAIQILIAHSGLFGIGVHKLELVP